MLERVGAVLLSHVFLERDKLNGQVVPFPSGMSQLAIGGLILPASGMLERVVVPGWSTPWSTVPLTSNLSKTTPTDQGWNGRAVERRQAWWAQLVGQHLALLGQLSRHLVNLVHS